MDLSTVMLLVILACLFPLNHVAKANSPIEKQYECSIVFFIIFIVFLLLLLCVNVGETNEIDIGITFLGLIVSYIEFNTYRYIRPQILIRIRGCNDGAKNEHLYPSQFLFEIEILNASNQVQCNVELKIEEEKKIIYQTVIPYIAPEEIIIKRISVVSFESAFNSRTLLPNNVDGGLSEKERYEKRIIVSVGKTNQSYTYKELLDKTPQIYI